MFTGIITRVGRVVAQEGGRLSIVATPWKKPLREGESIAVNGVCLTLTRADDTGWHFDVLEETFGMTNLGELHAGDSVNVERALCYGDEMGGHMVSGHVEGIGHLKNIEPVERDRKYTFSCDQQLTDQLVEKGSVAVNGVSLTLVDLKDGQFSVHLIPTTLAETNLGTLKVGDTVNLETDLIGKYVLRFLRNHE